MNNNIATADQTPTITIKFKSKWIDKLLAFLDKHTLTLIVLALTCVSIFFFVYYLGNNMGTLYNDAKSHLNIGRRVVEGLKPGLGQLGSVWLPLNHILMIPLIWNDWAWHSGFAGAIWNMISYVLTGVTIYKILEKLRINTLGRIIGIIVFVSNINILYLQSTALTEPLLLFTMTASCYYLISWAQNSNLLNLIKASFFIMLSTVVRYDGWFLLAFATFIVAVIVFFKRGYKVAEGTLVLFLTLASLGVVLWFGWNLAIFKDPLYFALGPFSAHAQQLVGLEAGKLPTKGSLWISTQTYFTAVMYACLGFVTMIGILGMIVLLLDKRIKGNVRFASLSLASPFLFNVIALFAGFSTLSVQGFGYNGWFNVRYGVMMLPAFAIFIGYIVGRFKNFRWVIIGLLIAVSMLSYLNNDSVVIADGYGHSREDVSEISAYLYDNAHNVPGYILISVASHDIIVFTSNLPTTKYIYEGTVNYWNFAVKEPERWVRWIVVRPEDKTDLGWKLVSQSPGFSKYHMIKNFQGTAVYELDTEYLPGLNTTPVLGKQK